MPEVEFRGKSQRQMRGQPAKTGIVRFSSPELMVPRLGGTTRDEVLAELTDRLEAEGFVVNGDEIYQEALNREAIVRRQWIIPWLFPMSVAWKVGV